MAPMVPKSVTKPAVVFAAMGLASKVSVPKIGLTPGVGCWASCALGGASTLGARYVCTTCSAAKAAGSISPRKSATEKPRVARRASRALNCAPQVGLDTHMAGTSPMGSLAIAL